MQLLFRGGWLRVEDREGWEVRLELTIFEKLGVVVSAERFVALDSWTVAPNSILLSKATSFLSSANFIVCSIILQLAHKMAYLN